VLQDYVIHGTQLQTAADGSSAFTLRFRPEVETSIYNTLPDHVGALLRQSPLDAPVAFMGRHQSVEVKQVGLQWTQTLSQGRVSLYEGSHLFPMERPAEAADAIAQQLRQLADLAA
jgi:hypothetical protein